MSSLLRRLHTEIFVLTLRNAVNAAPKLDGYLTTLVDDHTLEVEVSKEQNLNDIFSRLSGLGDRSAQHAEQGESAGRDLHAAGGGARRERVARRGRCGQGAR